MNATPSELVAVLLALNLFTFMAFGSDKERAEAGSRRISETRLLLLAALGGTPAAFLARQHYRHKTRKQPFTTRLYLIAAAQFSLIIGLFLHQQGLLPIPFMA